MLRLAAGAWWEEGAWAAGLRLGLRPRAGEREGGERPRGMAQERRLRSLRPFDFEISSSVLAILHRMALYWESVLLQINGNFALLHLIHYN